MQYENLTRICLPTWDIAKARRKTGLHKKALPFIVVGLCLLAITYTLQMVYIQSHAKHLHQDAQNYRRAFIVHLGLSQDSAVDDYHVLFKLEQTLGRKGMLALSQSPNPFSDVWIMRSDAKSKAHLVFFKDNIDSKLAKALQNRAQTSSSGLEKPIEHCHRANTDNQARHAFCLRL
jgi:hypothetical protein